MSGYEDVIREIQISGKYSKEMEDFRFLTKTKAKAQNAQNRSPLMTSNWLVRLRGPSCADHESGCPLPPLALVHTGAVLAPSTKSTDHGPT